MKTTVEPEVANASQTLTVLRAETGALRQELDQALAVWQSALEEEKKQWTAALEAQRHAYEAREQAWQEERRRYEERWLALEQQIKTQLVEKDQAALQALQELDQAWQSDKRASNQEAHQRIQELEKREAAWQSERQQQEAKFTESQNRITELEALLLQKTAEEARLRRVHDTGTAASAEYLRDLETRWNEQRERQEQLTHQLESTLAHLQSRLADAEQRHQAASQRFLNFSLQTLEHEVNLLHNVLSDVSETAPSQTPAHA